MPSSAEVRRSLTHPVIDADGHTVEYEPAVRDRLREIAGADVAARFGRRADFFEWYRMTAEDRVARRVTRPPWWEFLSVNTRDRATAMLPELMYRRLDETGIDFAVVYPTNGMFGLRLPDAELRQALARAHNVYHADVFGEFGDRLCPVAVIPMHTPEEAVTELDFAVGELGMRAVTMAGIIQRPIPAARDLAPELRRHATWVDALGLGEHVDYDPVWRRCAELGVTPTFHSGSMGWGSRTSPVNYMHNHIGHFGAAGHATCKALFFGGVTRRFPELRFAFLEGGVAWAANLFNDLVGHWEKRNIEAVHDYDPVELDVDLLEKLFLDHGGRVLASGDTDLRAALEELAVSVGADEPVDDWAAVGIQRSEDIGRRFVDPFFFGCEADDPMTGTAFDASRNAHGARLKAVFSSDMGHWDVPDITEVLEEAHELVDAGTITETDFRDFTFAHAAHLYGDVNPGFFEGTVVADACRRELTD